MDVQRGQVGNELPLIGEAIDMCDELPCMAKKMNDYVSDGYLSKKFMLVIDQQQRKIQTQFEANVVGDVLQNKINATTTIQMWEMKLCDLCNSCDTIFEIAKDNEKKNYAIK